MLRKYPLVLILLFIAPISLHPLTQNQFAGLLLSINLDPEAITWNDANNDGKAQLEEINGATPAQLSKIFNNARAISTADYNAYFAHCVEKREYDKAAILIEHDADPDARTSNNYRVLIWFIEENKEQIVDLLIKKGANVNIDGGTPLNTSVSYGNVKITESLLTAGADVNGGDGAVLAAACSSQNLEIVKMLLEAEADVNRGNGAALLAACSSQNLEIVKMLISSGVDVNIGNGTALVSACTSQNAEIVEMLISAGADVNRGDNSVLMMMCAALNVEIVKMLLDAGAELNVSWSKYPSPETAAMDYANSGVTGARDKAMDIINMLRDQREKAAQSSDSDKGEASKNNASGETAQKSGEYIRGKNDGEFAAGKVFNGAYYAMGIFIFGLPIAAFNTIDMPLDYIEGRSEDYVAGFKDGYTSRTRFSHVFSAAMGTVTIIGAVALILLIRWGAEEASNSCNSCISSFPAD